jgi:hypothetical protein
MMSARATARSATEFTRRADRLIRQVQTQLASRPQSRALERRAAKLSCVGSALSHPWIVTIVGGVIATAFGVFLTLWLT